MYRYNVDEEWERKKTYLLRTLFEDIPKYPGLSPVPESVESSRSPSPFPPSPPRRQYSPLPDLIIEKEPKVYKHDEPPEFYEQLEKTIYSYFKNLQSGADSDSNIDNINAMDNIEQETTYGNDAEDIGYDNDILQNESNACQSDEPTRRIASDPSTQPLASFNNKDSIISNEDEIIDLESNNESETFTPEDDRRLEISQVIDQRSVFCDEKDQINDFVNKAPLVNYSFTRSSTPISSSIATSLKSNIDLTIAEIHNDNNESKAEYINSPHRADLEASPILTQSSVKRVITNLSEQNNTPKFSEHNDADEIEEDSSLNDEDFIVRNKRNITTSIEHDLSAKISFEPDLELSPLNTRIIGEPMMSESTASNQSGNNCDNSDFQVTSFSKSATCNEKASSEPTPPKRSKISISTQTSERQNTVPKSLGAFFVRTPKVYKICKCKAHICD